jgi:hypothetical protein
VKVNPQILKEFFANLTLTWKVLLQPISPTKISQISKMILDRTTVLWRGKVNTTNNVEITAGAYLHHVLLKNRWQDAASNGVQVGHGAVYRSWCKGIPLTPHTRQARTDGGFDMSKFNH